MERAQDLESDLKSSSFLTLITYFWTILLSPLGLSLSICKMDMTALSLSISEVYENECIQYT